MSFGTAIKASIGADTSPLRADAQEAEGIIGNFAGRTKDYLGEVGRSILSSFGVMFAAEKVSDFFKEIYSEANQLNKLSRELGVGADSLQAFNRIVVETGASTENVNRVWEKARDSLDELRAGSAGAEKNFGALGLSAKDFIGLGLDESLEKIAKAYVENKNEAGAYDAVVSILGKRNVPQLMEALEKLGEEGFDKARKDADGFFKSIGPKSLIAFDEIKKASLSLFEVLKNGFANTFGEIYSDLKMVGLEILRIGSLGAISFEDVIKASSGEEEIGKMKEEEQAKNKVAAAAQAQAVAEQEALQASKDRLAIIENVAKHEAAGQDRDGKDIASAHKLLALKEMMDDEAETEEGRAAARVEYERTYLQLVERVGELQREQAREEERAAASGGAGGPTGPLSYADVQAGYQANTYGVGRAAEPATPARDSGGSLTQIHADLLGISNQLRNAGLL